MGIFKSGSFDSNPDQLEAKLAALKHQEWLESPIGQATTAYERGDGFFEIEMQVGTSKRSDLFGLQHIGKNTKKGDTEIITAIENAGWELIQTGYYFMPTGEISRNRFLATGQNTAIWGISMGAYLFKRKI